MFSHSIPYHIYCTMSNSLQDYTTTTSQDKQQSKPPPDKTKPFIDEDGFLVGFLQCMIIDTCDGQYKDTIKAVPMEKAADNSTGGTTAITSNAIKDIEVIQGYIERDPRKQLFSMHDDSKSQRSKQFYLDSIEELFKKCMNTGGGMCMYCSSSCNSSSQISPEQTQLCLNCVP